MGNTLVRVNGHAYENTGVLADGGFATVYKVRRRDDTYALKWIRGVAERDQLQRILREIQVLRQLQHPNSMRLIEAEVRVASSAKSTASGSPAKAPHATYQFASAATDDHNVDKEVLMVFPLYPRGSLQQHLQTASDAQRSAFANEAECLSMFVLIVEAVLELQARGYAHRDIKPHNILLTSDEPMAPILTDFGSTAPVRCIVQSAHDATTLFEEAAQYSSAAYRAPELWEAHSTSSFRGEIDGRTDVWSLGCLLYAMAYGPFSPFEDPVHGVLQLAIFSGNVRFPPTTSTRSGPAFSPGFQSLIRAMLAVDVQQRPTIFQLLDRVDELRTGRRASRSVSLRRSVSSNVKPAEQLQAEDWADFAAFDALSESASITSNFTIASATSSQSSWRVVSRHSVSSDTTDRVPSPRSLRRSSTASSRMSSRRELDHLNKRRTLSMQGKQLLATALQT